MDSSNRAQQLVYQRKVARYETRNGVVQPSGHKLVDPPSSFVQKLENVGWQCRRFDIYFELHKRHVDKLRREEISLAAV